MQTPWKIAALLAFPCLALATSVVPHTLRQRAAQADRVALVQVIDQRVERTGDAAIPFKTFTRVVVGADLKGTGPKELTVVQVGGSDGHTSLQVPGDAKFEAGQTAIVFLRCRLADDRCHLVAFGEGKLDLVGSKVRVHNLLNHEWELRTVESIQAELAGQPR